MAYNFYNLTVHISVYFLFFLYFKYFFIFVVQFASTMNNVKLPQSQHGLFRQFLLQRKAEVADSIKKLLDEQDDIEVTLQSIDNEETPKELFPLNDEIVIYENGYIPKWTFVRKIKFILDLKKRPLTARQITDIIINELEVEIWKDKSKKEKGALFGTISSTLTNNSKEGKDFEKAKNEIDENIYTVRQK